MRGIHDSLAKSKAANMIRIDCRGLSTDNLEDSEQMQSAQDCFVRHGYAILDHIVPEEMIRDLKEEFEGRYAQYVHDHGHDDSVEVGKRRFMIPVKLSGHFGNPQVFANPYVAALIRRILEPDPILEAFGAVVSLSGSEAQHVHADAPHLFTSELSLMLPAHALTFALPLVEMNDFHGTTAIWPGSHRWKEYRSEVEPIYPRIPIGSCLMWDFRTFHMGTPNLSREHRPMIYATYAMYWYQDRVNFKKDLLQRLIFDRELVDDLPEEARRLIAHVRGGGPAPYGL
jgi:ectoine hydroxylase-related dioxygenase (phytanoyl-CoA dioxygenase family)